MLVHIVAAAIALAGAAAFVYLGRSACFDLMSNKHVVLRGALFVLSFSLAVFVAGLAPPLDATSVQVFSVLAVVFALLLVGYSTWLVRVWRRQLVKRWEDGLPLPRGTSEASIRAWATAHGRDRGAPGCVG